MKRTIFILCAILISANLFSSPIHIIPEPKSVIEKPGYYNVNNLSGVFLNEKKTKSFENILFDFLREDYQVALPVTKRAGRNQIQLIADRQLTHEAYKLQIDASGIKIYSSGDAGFLYGMKTLKQMLVNSEGTTLPCVVIEDEPRFSYRGMMLDVARYFYPVEVIKSFIDQMADYKLNSFHWHLTEDYGWRIEIKKYPDLTQKGAWRRSTQYSKYPPLQDMVPHWGYYSQEEIRDIVQYASSRNIVVVPEIEMPGHAMAALSVFPHLSCTGGPFAVPVQWGIKEDIFCAGNEETFRFLEDVLTEVISLFPGEYIHIGGDEAPKKRWKVCPKCQQRMQTENLQNEEELQSYFVHRIAQFLETKGKKIIGWDEILQGESPPKNSVVMSWRGDKGGIEAANRNYEVIMTPNNILYFDRYQTKKYDVEPINIGGYVHLDSVYNYDPLRSLPVDKKKYIKGMQANIWMEYIHSLDMLEYMMYPRVLALSEIVWSKATKNYPNFKEKMTAHLAYLDKKHLAFRIPEVDYQLSSPGKNQSALQLNVSVKEAKVYYSFDKVNPYEKGTFYEHPVLIPNDTAKHTMYYMIVLPSGRTSAIYPLEFKE